MKAKASEVAQKLMNLYRQEHVILGGWAAVNQVLLNEATDDVIKEIKTLATGEMLARHIENLRSGKTKIDEIDRELMPYGGAFSDAATTTTLTSQQITELSGALARFTPDQTGLDMIQNLAVVKKYGNEWTIAIRDALIQHPQLMDKWKLVIQTFNAYRLWNQVHEIIAQPISDRTLAQVQADMPEYETYLPMFGVAGTELLNKLRNFINGAKPE